MTVLHIITDTNIGGAGRHLLTLLEYQEKFQIEVALPVGSALISELKGATCCTTYYEVPNLDDSKKGVSALSRLLREVKPDLVHTHASFAGRVAARLYGCPVVYTRHSVFPTSPGKLSKLVYGLLNRAFSDGIIAVSPAALENLVQQGTSADRVKVIYNGVPPLRECPPGEKAALLGEYGASNGSFVVSQIARLDDIKGHDYTLDAAKLLPDVIILIAGTGPMEAHLRRRIEEESIGNVILAGFVQNVDELLNITDLQINVSYGSEATSLALLEGMSLGVPAVASDFGGNPYVISHGINGLIFPQKDAAALAEAIKLIKDDRELYLRLSEGAKGEYNKRFRAEIMAREIESLYLEVLET